MSMWEYEALAEECVRLVGSSDWPLSDKRDAYGAIYKMVGGFDVSFIHFRTLDLLQEAQFFLRIDMEAHPEYAARKAEFDAIKAKSRSTWVPSYPAAEGEYPPADGLYDPKPHEGHAEGLWFDATMPLWEKARAAGLITGLAAEPITPLPERPFITRLMTLADGKGAAGHDLLKMLHGFVAALTGYQSDDPWAPGDPALAPALDLPNLAPALNTVRTGNNDWVDERFNARQALEWASGDARAFLDWWCSPYAD